MTMVRTVIPGTLSAGMLAGSALMASAAIVCRDDVCWHTHERYTCPRDAGVVVHEDDWQAGPSIRYREHEGRGYRRDDKWETFPAR
jgi:hypothetical protein